MNKITIKRLLILFCTLTIFWCNNLKAQCITTTTPTSCDSCNGTAFVTATGGIPPYTYQWNDPNFQTTPIANNLCAGLYTVLVTDANGSIICVNSAVIFSLLPLTATLTVTPSLPGVCNGVLTASVSGGMAPYSYAWMVNYTFISAPTLNPSFTGLCPGDTCCVTITDSLGCTFIDCRIIPGIILNIENASKDTKKTILKITNTLGQHTGIIKNIPLLYIYNDGTIEKKIIIE